MDIERVAAALQREAALLEEFAREQEKLLGSVRARTWQELEARLEALRGLEAGIQAAEDERIESLPQTWRDARGFAAGVTSLGGEARRTLERGYHALNLALIRVKGAVSRLDHYVGTVMGSLGTLLRELLPHRRGRIYSANGAERPASELPIVLNRSI